MKKLKVLIYIFLIVVLFVCFLYFLESKNNIRLLAESRGSASDVQLIARAINR